MEEQGVRENSGKLKWSLVSMRSLAPMVRVLMFGAQKYEDHNWKKGLKYTEICESLQRHLNSFMEGKDNDSESKLSHVGHILCNAMFLSYMTLFRKDMDDRYVDKNFKLDPTDFEDTDEYRKYLLSESAQPCIDHSLELDTSDLKKS